MINKWMAKSLMVVGALAAVAGASNAQIVNGNFSSGLSPWVAGGFGTAAGNGGILNDSFSLPGGGNYYWLNDGPGPSVGLSQAFTISAPANINIRGQYATRVGGTGTNSFVVRVLDANTNATLSQFSFNPTAVGNWTSFNVTTTSIGVSNVRLLFIGQANGFDDDYMIDNITATSTPEPGAVALIALALIPGVAVLRRRK